MRLKISLRRLLLIISTGGIVISSAVIVFLFFNFPVQGSNAKPPAPAKPATLPSPAKTAPNAPLRLLIPKIKVNAAVESVGLTKDGAVGVPKGFTNAAWFNAGVRPGEIGSAIIDGHFGWIRGVGAVFNNLSKLRAGDKVYVKDKTGKIITFAVRATRTYSLQDSAAEVFGASDGQAHLNLITCEGVWKKATQSYSRRLVVFTDKE